MAGRRIFAHASRLAESFSCLSKMLPRREMWSGWSVVAGQTAQFPAYFSNSLVQGKEAARKDMMLQLLLPAAFAQFCASGRSFRVSLRAAVDVTKVVRHDGGGEVWGGFACSGRTRGQTRGYAKMANRSIRDERKRNLVNKYEMKRAHYKAICNDRSIPSQIRYDFGLKLSKLPRNSSKTRVKNRCVFTGRSHSVYRKFGISRIVFRELARRGALTGVKKSMW